MRIKLSSVMVNDQEKAVKFYTEVLGFVKKIEFNVGNSKWITVISPDDPNDIELLLEPMGFPVVKTYQKALHKAKIPLAVFFVENLQKEYERLIKLGVVFITKPIKTEVGSNATFDDTCGNNINLHQI